MPRAEAKDIFVLPHQGQYIIYAPLASRVVRANADCVAQLKRYLHSGDPADVEPDLIAQLGGLGWLDELPLPHPLPLDRQFHPTTATLFLTNRCNLRCRYCYASAGEFHEQDMPADVYRAAIDLVARNAMRAGQPMRIGFHGGGEPTAAWNSLSGAVEYTQELAARHHHTATFSLATNGVMTQQKMSFLADTFSSFTVSFDGPKDIQDRQRPFADGRGSFESVAEFVRLLNERKKDYAIRTTVTSLTVRRLPELVDFFVAQMGCKRLRFEPMFTSGRGRIRMDEAPSAEEFTDYFIKALRVARTLGVDLRYSAARLHGTFLCFCGCAYDAFNVTHDGYVTGCYEVCSFDSPLAHIYYFGQFSRACQVFNIDMAKLAALRSLTVVNKPECQRCFAKWTCSGDCPVKNAGLEPGSPAMHARCEMNRTITRELLINTVERPSCMCH